ncbi:hypothetical protein EDB81DRAFT_50340 [Dactylonectria macrodidyma]|uniref:BZIP transcription factor n=1 Tax=Dactylonectria macrodidyma TaxID=307937 RepID=A0A9P9JNI4_9HYPO|nr:hypothetical protein EDB81DRAFT_50340 [Dactylonectria macrodidyma]
MAPTPSEKDLLETRQARKRELDRRAQRAARERNRNRIAFLEATIDAMKQQESSRGVAHLTDQLMEITRQRDHLAETLSSIKDTIHYRHPPQSDAAAKVQPATEAATSLPPPDDQINLGQDLVGVDMNSPPLDSAVSELWGIQSPSEYSRAPQNDLPVTSTSTTLPEDLNFYSLFQPSIPLSVSDTTIIPAPEIACDCLVTSPTVEDVTSPPSNIWRMANEVLGKKEMLCRNTLQLEDELFEDTPIRAILEGWDVVASGTGLPPLWNRLRQIDELQFRDCGDTERLAIMSTMHRMLRHRADSTEEQWARLPPWLLSRPSQSLPHSSAIDFFVWPGVRERFVFSQHQYCSNSFWKLFVECFRISWPFEFRDCYKKNTRTGRYSISPEFMDCIWNINSWTMTTDFFGTFPEMYSDIPSFMEVPRFHLNTQAERTWHSHRMDSLEIPTANS